MIEKASSCNIQPDLVYLLLLYALEAVHLKDLLHVQHSLKNPVKSLPVVLVLPLQNNCESKMKSVFSGPGSYRAKIVKTAISTSM